MSDINSKTRVPPLNLSCLEKLDTVDDKKDERKCCKLCAEIKDSEDLFHCMICDNLVGSCCSEPWDTFRDRCCNGCIMLLNNGCIMSIKWIIFFFRIFFLKKKEQ